MIGHRLLALGIFATLAAPTSADEVRVRDGSIHVGRVQKRGEVLRITTRDGQVVEVPRDDVVRVRTTAQLRRALADLARGKRTAFHHVQVGKQAREWDLRPQMWHHVDAAIRASRSDQRARARVDAFLLELGPELRALGKECPCRGRGTSRGHVAFLDQQAFARIRGVEVA